MKQETIQLIENEARLNETIENLESQISKPLVPADSSSWSSSPKELAYDDSVYEMDDRTEALVSSSYFTRISRLYNEDFCIQLHSDQITSLCYFSNLLYLGKRNTTFA